MKYIVLFFRRLIHRNPLLKFFRAHIRNKHALSKSTHYSRSSFYCLWVSFIRINACYIFNHNVWLSTNNFTPTKSSRGF